MYVIAFLVGRRVLSDGEDANMSSHLRSSLSANTYIGRKYIMLPSMPLDRLDVLRWCVSVVRLF